MTTGKIVFVTLGCAKNQVDSEVMLGMLRKGGFEPVRDPAQAEIAVVNTCGFLGSAVNESIDTILEVARLKKEGRLKRLVVVGCLVPRYGSELKAALPEVDLFLPPDRNSEIVSAIKEGCVARYATGARPYLYDHTAPRELPTGAWSAYVKIADGCSRRCSFCIIPKLRGALHSRVLESIVREVETLSTRGIKEVNLVAQDLTAYGMDLGGPGLVDLLRALDHCQAVEWIRALYAYPVGVTNTLLEAIVELPSVCEYLDLPLQHSSERVLRAMRRPLGKFAPRTLVERIRKRYPAIALRTTFITGFPGEEEADFEDLLDFVREGHFLSVGAFVYSHEEGSPAYRWHDSVPTRIKAERLERLMLAQKESASRRLRDFIGRKLRVLLEGRHPESEHLLSARARFQAPEVDGRIIINDAEIDLSTSKPGEFLEVEVTQICGYDLLARVVGQG